MEASGDFGQCTGLWPEFAWGYFNRGCVLDRAGAKAAAVLDYTAALERDPGLAPAYVNRGLALLELRRDARALADFDRAVALGARAAAVSAGRGVALERLGRHEGADAAFADGFAQAGDLDAQARARLARAYGFAISTRDPAKARRAFEDALRHEPRDAKARYGLGMIAMARGEDGPALREFDRALEADPSSLEARRYRAILLARRGDWEAATREINGCLARAPVISESLRGRVRRRPRPRGPSVGRDGRAGAGSPRRAAAEGADLSRAAEDPDLAAIRRLPRFRRLVGPDRRPATAHPAAPIAPAT